MIPPADSKPNPVHRASRVGVTLLELLIVVFIVAILAGVALPSYTRTVEKARVQEAEGILTTVYQAERIYRLDFGGFGTLPQLTGNGYLTAPSSDSWIFTIPDASVTNTTFQALASRTGGAQFLRINETGQICQSGYAVSVSNRPACQ